MGRIAIGTTDSGSASNSRSSSLACVPMVVRADVAGDAPAASSMFWTHGKMDAGAVLGKPFSMFAASKTACPENGSRPGSSSSVQAERDQIERSLPNRRDYRPLTPGEIAAIADTLGGLINIPQSASPTDRAAVYQQLGINLTYNPTANQIHALADLARVGCRRRVEGGTFPPTTRETSLDLAA